MEWAGGKESLPSRRSHMYKGKKRPGRSGNRRKIRTVAVESTKERLVRKVRTGSRAHVIQ